MMCCRTEVCSLDGARHHLTSPFAGQAVTDRYRELCAPLHKRRKRFRTWLTFRRIGLER